MARDARVVTQSEAVTVSRRWVLRWSVIGSLVAVAVSTSGRFAMFIWPKRTDAFGSKVVAGKPDSLRVGETRYVQDGKFYLTRLPEGFLALYRKCPHMGCVISWRPDAPAADTVAPKGRFSCPCHGSLFDLAGRVYKNKPAPDNLPVPPHTYLSENKILIGEDHKGA